MYCIFQDFPYKRSVSSSGNEPFPVDVIDQVCHFTNFSVLPVNLQIVFQNKIKPGNKMIECRKTFAQLFKARLGLQLLCNDFSQGLLGLNS